MDLKKKIKGFFTLTRKANSGFTLVELIVVIAILAILGGVAVPAYSGYVTKANKSADEQLIADIEKALTLAGYNGTFAEGEGGYITLSATTPFTSTEAIGVSEALDNALKATFGEGYSLQLEHDEWGNNGLLTNLDKDSAYVVSNSSYITGNRADKLLSDVEKLTKTAGNVANVLTGSTSLEVSLTSMFNGVVDTTADKYGVNKGEYDTWEEWSKASEENKTAYGNLLVLSAAEDMKNFTTNGTPPSTASTYIAAFANYYAFAAQEGNEAFSAKLDEQMAKLEGIQTASEGSNWLKEVESLANSAGYTEAAVAQEQMAFVNILGALGNTTDEQADLITAGLTEESLFTKGVVNDMYNEYLTMVNSAASMGSDFAGITMQEGEIALMFVQQNGVIELAKSMLTE